MRRLVNVALLGRRREVQRRVLDPLIGTPRAPVTEKNGRMVKSVKKASTLWSRDKEHHELLRGSEAGTLMSFES